jgi:capsular exopolysaccharide synthesis family protein
MSRIFDALQKLGVEQSGVEYPDLISVVTQVLEAPADVAHTIEEPVSRATATQTTIFDFPPTAPSTVKSPTLEMPSAAVPPPKEAEQRPLSEILTKFPTIHVKTGPSSRLVTVTEPQSLAAEKFRFLGVRLRQLQKTRTLKKVLVTSTIPEEGKSMVSANLAVVLHRKQRVLLIDGDLRRPVLAEQFGLGKLPGIAEWLQGDRRELANIYQLDPLGIWLFPAGNPPVNPLELMSSATLNELMKELSELFDWIIVDSPPLLPLADTTVWSRVTDGTLLVARVGKTEKAQLLRGLDVVKKSDLIGVVLNSSEHTEHDYYQRYVPTAMK